MSLKSFNNENKTTKNTDSSKGLLKALENIIITTENNKDNDSFSEMELIYLKNLHAFLIETIKNYAGSDHMYTYKAKAEAAGEISQIPKLWNLADKLMDEAIAGAIKEMGKGISGDYFEESGSIQDGMNIIQQIVEELALIPQWHNKLIEILNNPECYGFDIISSIKKAYPEAEPKGLIKFNELALEENTNNIFRLKPKSKDLSAEDVINFRGELLITAAKGVLKTNPKLAISFLKEYFRISNNYSEKIGLYNVADSSFYEQLLEYETTFKLILNETKNIKESEIKDDALLEIAFFFFNNKKINKAANIVIYDIKYPSYWYYWYLLENLVKHYFRLLDNDTKLTVECPKEIFVENIIKKLEEIAYEKRRDEHNIPRAQLMIVLGDQYYERKQKNKALPFYNEAWKIAKNQEPNELLEIFAPLYRGKKIKFPKTRKELLNEAYTYAISKLTKTGYISSGEGRYLLPIIYEYALDGNYKKAEKMIMDMRKYIRCPDEDISNGYKKMIKAAAWRGEYEKIKAFISKMKNPPQEIVLEEALLDTVKIAVERKDFEIAANIAGISSPLESFNLGLPVRPSIMIETVKIILENSDKEEHLNIARKILSDLLKYKLHENNFTNTLEIVKNYPTLMNKDYLKLLFKHISDHGAGIFGIKKDLYRKLLAELRELYYL